MNDFNTHQSDAGSLDELPPQGHHDSQPPASSDDILDAIEVHLDNLPPRQTMTLARALQRLAPAIKKLREKGYAVDEVAAALAPGLSSLGLTVSGRTLARLMPSKASKARVNAQRKAA